MIPVKLKNYFDVRFKPRASQKPLMLREISASLYWIRLGRLGRIIFKRTFMPADPDGRACLARGPLLYFMSLYFGLLLACFMCQKIDFGLKIIFGISYRD